MLKSIIFTILLFASSVTLATQTHSTPTSLNTASKTLSSQDGFPAAWNKNVGVATYYDDELGMIADVKYKHAFSKSNAAAIELEGGERIGRINTSFAHAFSPNHRVKLNLERLEEKLDFDFDSGETRRWDGQNAIGADYQYLLGSGLINAFHLGGYYSHAHSKNLDDKEFNYEGSTLTNTRRITGANSGNLNTGLEFKLWPQSRLHVDLDYDRVHYDMKNDPPADDDDDNGHDNNANGFGTSFGLDQVILPQLKASIDTELRKPYKDYQGELSYLLPSPKQTQLELAYITDYMHSLSTHRNFFSNGVRLNISWDQTHEITPKPYYTLMKTPKLTLADWAAIPAVRMPEILAVVDQVSRNMSGTVIPISRMSVDCCPAVSEVQAEGGGFYETEDQTWFTMQRANTNAEVTTFDGAEERHRGNGSMVECTYSTDTPNHTVTLVNSNPNQYVETPIGDHWLQRSGTEVCYGHWNPVTGTGDLDPSACEFEFDSLRFEKATPENNERIVNTMKNVMHTNQVDLKNLRHKLKHFPLG